jgi:GntP family gluconate:H+ symporter
LIPIGKAMRRKTGKNYLLYILTIVAGGTMAHSLVPPTPGPLFVAAELGVDIGTMMLAGMVVGTFTISFGYAYATWANRHWEIPLREEDDAEIGAESEITMPPVFFAFLPILLPVVLIGIATYRKTLDAAPGWLDALAYLGDKNLALTISAAVAMLVLLKMKRGERAALSKATKSAITSGASIIMITAAGAAFGGVLRHTGIADTIATLGGSESGIMTLLIAFAVTALVRTAQGSATVAMITAAPIALAFLDAGTLGFHPVYLALAIGCGSKPIPWMNDSGFWVITRMTGMTESETLRFVTPMMSSMGVVGLVVTMVAAKLVPLV